MHDPAEYTACCCLQWNRPEIQGAAGPIEESHSPCEMWNLSDVISSHGRQMHQPGGNCHRIHLLHQAAEPLFVPEEIGEIR